MKYITLMGLNWMRRHWFELNLTSKQLSHIDSLIIKVKNYGTHPTRKS